MDSSLVKFFYANVRSIRAPGKFEELQCILRAIESRVNVIILTETWLQSEQDAKFYSLPNYNHIYNYRPDRIGGGVSIYLHKSIHFEVTEDKYRDSNHYLWIFLPRFSLHVGGIYKPGDTNIKDFLEIFSQQLEIRKRSIVFGDFNLDLLNNDTTATTTQYLQTLEDTGYEVLNKLEQAYYTRRTETTNTIIDHALTDLNKSYFHVALIDSSMSDHRQIYMEFFRCKKETKPRIQYEATDYDSLCKDIEQATYSNENNDYKHLENFIKSHLNKNKTKKYKIMNLPKDDWINKEVINMINNRNMLWRRLKSKSGDENLKKEFIKVRNEVQLRIRKDKKKLFSQEISILQREPEEDVGRNQLTGYEQDEK